MYDRKTWIALTLCGLALALNFHFASKDEKKRQTEQAHIEAAQKSALAEKETTNETTAELTVEPLLPPTAEEFQTLTNGKVIYTFSNIGGGIKHAEFKDEFEVGTKDVPVQMNRRGPGPIGAFANSNLELENLPFTYLAEQSVEGQKVAYSAQLANGLTVTKTYSLIEGKDASKPGAPYLLNFDLSFSNTSTAAVNLNQWSIFLGEASPLYQREISAQTGFFWRSDNRIDFKHSGKFNKSMFSAAKSTIKSDTDQPIQLAGVTNQYFTTAIQPLQPTAATVWGQPDKITLKKDAAALTAVKGGLQLPSATVSPGETKSLQYHIFIGPKHNTMLRKMDGPWGEGWGDLMQYGWFSIVSRILNSTLNLYHGWLDHIAKNWSWGLAIILLTITIRALIWPLHAKSTHTMKRMAMLKPEMEKLREKYADDPNKLNTETMGLYRKYGINPVGGCLPMLIQIPIFFGFYRMLQYAVELRGHSFLWVPDLSQPDTLASFALPFSLPIIGTHLDINLLPIVMAITSFVQIHMTPSSGDKNQQMIMKFMPLMFFFFCYNFASALALYWTTQNIFSIGQTWLMSKVPEPKLKPVQGGGKSWVQRMAERQAELQRQQKSNPQGMRDITPKKRPPRTGG